MGFAVKAVFKPIQTEVCNCWQNSERHSKQPKQVGATLERPKIVSDSVSPTKPKLSTFLTNSLAPNSTASYALADVRGLTEMLPRNRERFS
jgi:hypothetical protein